MIRLGVDFGSSGTVISRFDTVASSTDTGPLYSPNLVHITADCDRITGNDVIARGLFHSGTTIRHMRHFILRNSAFLVNAGPHTVTCQQAGKEYLVSLIREAASMADPLACEVVFSMPEDAPREYADWLASVASGAGFLAYHCIDEMSAAFLGYGIPVQPDQTIMLVDFGADTLEVSIGSPPRDTVQATGTFRVVGRAIADIGGQAIDRWLAEEYLAERSSGFRYRPPQPGRAPEHEQFRQVKESLSFQEQTSLVLPESRSGAGPGNTVVITRSDLEKILERHGLSATIASTIEKAVSAARMQGYEETSIASVLMIGGGCLIPSVQEQIVQRFGPARVRFNHAREAVALGAACYRPKHSAPRQIARDYALRYWDPATRQHQYRYIVRSGTEYPTNHDCSRLLITASYDGQTHLGLAVYSLGGDQPAMREIELVTDPHGSLRCHEHVERPLCFAPEWINGDDPTILVATPPAAKGAVRFELVFRIDIAGYLIVSARDVQSGAYVLEDHNVAKLT